MSKIIKAFQIIGEHKLADVDFEQVKGNDNETEELKEQGTDNKNLNQRPHKKIEKAEKKAQSIIAEAKDEAQTIVEEAENRAEEVREQAHREGLTEGKKEAQRKVEEQFEIHLEEFKEVITELRQEKNRENKKLTLQVINMAVKIAERIVHTQLDVKSELINNIVQEMIEDLNENYDYVNIKISPELKDFLNEKEVESFFGDQEVEFTADRSLEKGDCLIETNFGGTDGLLENKLELIKEKLYEGAGYYDGSGPSGE